MLRRAPKIRLSLALAAMTSVSLLAMQAHAQSTGTKTSSKTTTTTTSTGSKPATTVLNKAPKPTAARPITASWGDVNPFWGDVNPFWGDVNPFWGDVNPFWGDVNPFWGDVNPFWGDVNPFWGDVNPFATTSNGAVQNSSLTSSQSFWGSLPGYTDAKGKSNGQAVGEYWKEAGSKWKEVMTVWAKAQSSGSASDLKEVNSKVGEVVKTASEFWGTTYTGQTGKAFTSGFVTPLLAKYGVSTSDPSSYAKLTKTQQAMLFMEFYDGLMNYAKADHVDHWMRTARWSPQLTQTMGSGTDTVIGLLDFTVLNGSIVKNNVVSYGGASKFTNGHGAGVASLMVGAHDGAGVMGISPRSRVVAYNPFDETGTASWEDIANGVKLLTSNKASIINMSLGVPGSVLDAGWNTVFSRPDVAPSARNALFIVAAGNQGVTQTNDLAWNFATNPQLLIVGSVTMDGRISNFSNRPGNACLLNSGVCQTGARLMDRFLVAPGELILVEDDQGGVKRVSGTSFAAPLVSGAAALIQDRWPWFAAKPAETAQILLRSARDLGAPGVDSVYGAGLLDITAAQSPLDFGALRWYTVSSSGKMTEYSVKQVLKDFDSEKLKGLQSVGLYYYAFETIGSVERDFGIPLSSRLVGKTFTTQTGAAKYFQDYIFTRLNDWAKSQPRSLVQTGLGFGPGAYPVANPWGADLTLSVAPREPRSGFVADGVETQSRLHLTTDGVSTDFGLGDGARYLTALSSRAVASDFDPAMGGASPMLGFASGGAFVGYQAQVTDRLTLTTGATQRRDRRDDSAGSAVIQPGSAAETYSARAATLGIRYRVSDRVMVSGAYVRLRENAAVLGVQSLEASDLGSGASSDAMTLGLDADLSAGLYLSLSGSVGQTRAAEGLLRTDADGLRTSAWQATLSAQDLIAKGDSARLSILQPLYIEKGRMAFSGVEVVDRLTGERAVVTRTFDVAQERPFAAEAQYGRAFGRTEISFFGRVDVNPVQLGQGEAFLGGARLRIGF